MSVASPFFDFGHKGTTFNSKYKIRISKIHRPRAFIVMMCGNACFATAFSLVDKMQQKVSSFLHLDFLNARENCGIRSRELFD